MGAAGFLEMFFKLSRSSSQRERAEFWKEGQVLAAARWLGPLQPKREGSPRLSPVPLHLRRAASPSHQPGPALAISDICEMGGFIVCVCGGVTLPLA